jgi:thiol-disulfide isomerase/thioredoxin
MQPKERDVNKAISQFFVLAMVTAASAASNADNAVQGDTQAPSLLRSHWAPMMKPEMSYFEGASGWVNSPALTPAHLRGKVVLVDFWTYSCINWRREFPYVRSWANKYRDRGLVVIGVHTPEFKFERSPENVKRAIQEIGVDYPVALDNELSVWRAFGNAYWPAIYLMDSRGVVRYHHFGEGDYEATERAIQRLLAEVDQIKAGDELVVPESGGAEAPADWANLRSPENYVGLARTSGLTVSALNGQARTYAPPSMVRANEWAPVGNWVLGSDSAVLQEARGRIVYGFHARDLHIVMGPSEGTRSVRFRVLIDGKPPGAAHGIDVDEQGFGTVTSPRMYQLIRQPGAIRYRRFEVEFLDPGVEVFSFTFG